VFVSNVLGQPLRCLNDGQGVHAGEPCRHPTTKAGCSELNACTCVVRKAAGAGDRGACIVEYTYAAEDAARALQSLRISVAAQFQPASRDFGPTQAISEPVKKEVPTEHSTTAIRYIFRLPVKIPLDYLSCRCRNGHGGSYDGEYGRRRRTDQMNRKDSMIGRWLIVALKWNGMDGSWMG
jgi:hypothetical protein